MLKPILCILLLLPTFICSQTQIGNDIDGESASDLSGHSVCLNANGNIIAVGSKDNDDNGTDSGHVRVYENLNGLWTQIGADIDGENAGDQSSWSLDINSAGNIIAIGAPSNDGNGNDSGHIRIYENLNGVWTQIGADIDGENAGDQSGYSLSLNANGTIVAVGAIINNGNGANAGHVRVFENQSGVWTQIGADIDGEVAGDESGFSVSLSANGAIVAIGAITNNGNGSNSGHVRIFENQTGNWTQVGNDIDGESSGDLSGRSISLNADGSIIAIGATSNDGNGNSSGHVRVFENLGNVWTQIGADIDGEAAANQSGYAVSLNDTGNVVAIGARFNNGNGNNSGHIRVFKHNNGNWVQVGSDIDGEAAGDLSGFSVSLNADGSIVAIGAIANSDNGAYSGHTRVYDLNAVLSIEDNNLLEVSIYPIPVKEVITLSHKNIDSKIKHIEIYNSIGQRVMSMKHNLDAINVSKLKTGTYFIKLYTETGNSTTKFIKE